MWAFWARAQPDREMIPVRFFSRDLISSYSASSVSGLRNICIRYLLRIIVQSPYLSGDYVPRSRKLFFFCKNRQSLCLFADYVLRAGKRFFCKNIQLLYLFGDYVPRTVLDPLVNFGNIISDDTQTYHDKTARKALQDNDRCEALESGAGIPFV